MNSFIAAFVARLSPATRTFQQVLTGNNQVNQD